MSRPRRYGPARSVRLPFEADEALVARADTADTPVSVWMRDQLLILLGVKPKPKAEVAAPSTPKRDVARAAAGEEAEQRADDLAAAKAEACEHDWGPPSTALGGQRRCRKCGAVKK